MVDHRTGEIVRDGPAGSFNRSHVKPTSDRPVLNQDLLARVNLPFMGSYCASKAAALSLTQGLRGELAPQGVHVAGALPGAVETRMTAMLTIPKMTTADAAAEILDGFEAGEEDIYVGEMARGLAQGLAHDPKAVERQLASPG